LLVGGLGHDIFPFSWEFIIPTDFHIFQRGSNHQPVYIAMENRLFYWVNQL
jgi:hypothetical protein